MRKANALLRKRFRCLTKSDTVYKAEVNALY